jgi:hypothetical protein
VVAHQAENSSRLTAPLWSLSMVRRKISSWFCESVLPSLAQSSASSSMSSSELCGDDSASQNPLGGGTQIT